MKSTDNRNKLSPAEVDRLSNLVIEHRNVIHRIIYNALSPQFTYLVDDCESDVILIAVEHAAELLSHPNATGWFVLTARNIAHNARRKEITRTHNLISVSEFKSKTEIEPLEDILYKDWINDGIPEELIARLAPREREVYNLIFVEHMSTKEISDKLCLRESTVRNIKKHIIDKIKYDIQMRNFKSL